MSISARRALLLPIMLTASLQSMPSLLAAPDYPAAVRQLEEAVREEMAEWQISGIAIALVDDQQTVHAAGYGEARRDSVFRCGSVSKLFNALAVMQFVEQGKLDLDAPVETYGAGLLPVNPFTSGTDITLRQLLCHRSGMIRESPVGGYFDETQPGLARTVASVAQTVLVNPPNTKTRYSNVGPSIAGRVVELASGQSFERYQRDHVLEPLGMTNSAWLLKEVATGRLLPSWLRVADGHGGFRHERCPDFDLGTIPAGNLYSSVDDLARFVSMLAAQGRAPGGQVLSAGSLDQMITPQLTGPGGAYGLGFGLGTFQGFKIIRHSGAVYGHSSMVAFLPEAKLGVVVLANEDIVNARVQRLANLALSLMLEAQRGVKPPKPPQSMALPPDALSALAGDYESQSFWAELRAVDGRLTGTLSGQPVKLRPLDSLHFLADSRMHDAATVVFERNGAGRVSGFTLGPQKFTRVPSQPPAIPREWQAYLGSYGPPFIPLVLSVRHGHLYAMTENLADYRLTPLNRQVFAMPPGLYEDEQLVVLTDRQGQPHGVNLANMILPRR